MLSLAISPSADKWTPPSKRPHLSADHGPGAPLTLFFFSLSSSFPPHQKPISIPFLPSNGRRIMLSLAFAAARSVRKPPLPISVDCDKGGGEKKKRPHQAALFWLPLSFISERERSLVRIAASACVLCPKPMSF